MTVLDVCHRLGISRASFYRIQDELHRIGLRELPSIIRTRRFDPSSVEEVATQYR